MLRAVEDSHDQPFSSTRQYFANVDNAPVSPRQLAQDDPRRSTLAVPQSGRAGGQANNFYRPQVPSGLSISTRRPYGSIGGTSPSQVSPSRAGLPPPPPPGLQPPSASEPPGGMPRRHTSADIRAHGWQAIPSPFGASGPPSGPPSGPSSGPWPSSPNRGPAAPEEQRIRDSLSQYSLQTASQPHARSRPATPPQPPFINGSGSGPSSSQPSSAGPSSGPNSGSALGPGHSADNFGGWAWNAGSRAEGKSLGVKDTLMQQERRGSVAHILNPTDAADRHSEDDGPRGEDDRKRKRVQ